MDVIFQNTAGAQSEFAETTPLEKKIGIKTISTQKLLVNFAINYQETASNSLNHTESLN